MFFFSLSFQMHIWPLQHKYETFANLDSYQMLSCCHVMWCFFQTWVFKFTGSFIFRSPSFIHQPPPHQQHQQSDNNSWRIKSNTLDLLIPSPLPTTNFLDLAQQLCQFTKIQPKWLKMSVCQYARCTMLRNIYLIQCKDFFFLGTIWSLCLLKEDIDPKCTVGPLSCSPALLTSPARSVLVKFFLISIGLWRGVFWIH